MHQGQREIAALMSLISQEILLNLLQREFAVWALDSLLYLL